MMDISILKNWAVADLIAWLQKKYFIPHTQSTEMHIRFREYCIPHTQSTEMHIRFRDEIKNRTRASLDRVRNIKLGSIWVAAIVMA